MAGWVRADPPREEVDLQKLTLDVDGHETALRPEAVFERRPMSDGRQKLVLISPPGRAGLFRQLVQLLPGTFYVLYVLHTPRGEAEAARYQSPELSLAEVDALLERYGAYFAADARHDLWVYALASRQTMVWDRHNLIFIEGDPLEPFVAALVSQGFNEAPLTAIGDHNHHYRPEFDADAADLLAAMSWTRTPLRPEDEQ